MLDFLHKMRYDFEISADSTCDIPCLIEVSRSKLGKECYPELSPSPVHVQIFPIALPFSTTYTAELTIRSVRNHSHPMSFAVLNDASLASRIVSSLASQKAMVVQIG